MHWFAWLITVCLMAAGTARGPAPGTLDRHCASVEDASDLANLVPRRPVTFAPDKRSDRRVDVHAAPPTTATSRTVGPQRATTLECRALLAIRISASIRSRGPPVTCSLASHQLPS